MWAVIRQEPVAFQGVIQAAIGLALAFGMHLSTGQVAAIVAFTAAVLSFLTRQFVTPVANPKDANGAPLSSLQLRSAA